MTKDTARCTACSAAFEGEGADDALAAHTEAFHPAGAPVERAIVTQADAKAVGKDFGPAVSGLAGKIGDQAAEIADLQERVKALEEGRRSATDLDVLAEQVAARIRTTAAVPVEVTPATPEATEPTEPTFRDLQARAKDLGIPASGTKEELQVAIAAEELRVAEEAAAARAATETGSGT